MWGQGRPGFLLERQDRGVPCLKPFWSSGDKPGTNKRSDQFVGSATPSSPSIGEADQRP